MNRQSTWNGGITGCGAVLLLAAGAVSAVAFGQTATTTDAQRASEESPADIIVIATKREERLQDVPLAISVVSGTTLEQYGADRPDALRVSGVHLGESGAANPQFIRGIGSGGNGGFEQSAPLYSDGIWLGRSFSQRLAFLDVDRIEVLKGPQPTYFGKNAIAGAITTVSRRPTSAFETGVDTSYEFVGDEGGLDGFVSGPLSKNVSARLAARYGHMEGWMRNVATDERLPRTQDVAARGSLLFTPDSGAKLFLKGEYLKYEEHGRPIQLIGCVPGGQFDPAVEDCTLNRTRAVSFNRAVFDPPSNPFFDDSHPGPDFREVEFKGATGQGSLDLGGASVTLVSAYYEQDVFSWSKNDNSTRQRVSTQVGESYEFFSSELRAASSGSGPLQWLTGIYYDWSHLQTPTIATVIVNLQQGQRGNVTQSADSYSAFGELSYSPIEQLEIRAALRYDQVEKHGFGHTETYRVNPTTNLLLSAQDFPGLRSSDHAAEPAVTAEFRPREWVMLYGSYRQGFKSGGIDFDLASPDPARLIYRPEKVDYYEAGAKLTIAPRAIFNVALFRGDYRDLQQSIFNPDTGVFQTTNAGRVRSQGVEIESQWRPVTSLTLGASAAWLDATYLENKNVSCFNNPPQTAAQGCVLVGPGVLAQDLSGQPTPFAPKWSGNLSADLDAPLGFKMFGGGVSLIAGANLFWTSHYQASLNGDPQGVQAGFAKLDARIGLGAEDGTWQLALAGRNLTNRITAGFVGDQARGGTSSAQFAITERAREVMLQLRVRTR